MNTIFRNSTTVIGAIITATTAFLLAIVTIVILHGTVAADEASSGRLVTIHDRGEEKVLLTGAHTIREAIEDAGITIDSRDAVEPSLDQELIATEYQINIYRARPVTIVDGDTRQKIITPYQTVEQIALDADLRLAPEDIGALSLSSDLLSGAGLQLTIDRAVPVKLGLYGTTSTVYTQGETVEELLSEKEITLGEKGRTSVSLSTPITANMKIRIWQEGIQTITVQEKQPFKVERIYDADRPAGYREVTQQGKNGVLKVTYEIEIKNGKEVNREKLASIVAKPSKKQIEVIGTKVDLNISYSADRAAIMTEAGVAKSDQSYAAYIINNENALWCAIRWQGTTGCAANYYEKFPGAESSSQVGYGLCQATPAIKMATAGSDWRTNSVTQMRWCHGYAVGRYGSWEAAYRFKVENGWW